MDDLKRIEGKTIKSIERDTNGADSYLIIKFKEGGKVNIVSSAAGDGVGQLDVVTEGIKIEDAIGKIIHSTIEEFDGENDYLILNLKTGGKITVNAFGSSESSNAVLSVDVYVESKKIAENKISQDSMKKFVAESLDESLELNEMGRRGRPRKQSAEFDMDKPSIENIDNIGSSEDLALTSQIEKMLTNELSVGEFSRGTLDFTIKSTGEKISGVPLVKMGGGKSFLFKTPNGMKKVQVNDMNLG